MKLHRRIFFGSFLMFSLFAWGFLLAQTNEGQSEEKKVLLLAPLMPLEPKFPLGLTQANRELQEAEAAKDQQALQQTLARHTFPLTLFLLVCGLSLLGVSLYFTRTYWLKWLFPPIPQNIIIKQQLLETLQTLEKQQITEENVADYALQLHMLVLKALQLHLKVKIEHLTTVEIEKVIQVQSSFSDAERQTLINFLQEVERIKFTHRGPMLETTLSSFEAIRGWIDPFLKK